MHGVVDRGPERLGGFRCAQDRSCHNTGIICRPQHLAAEIAPLHIFHADHIAGDRIGPFGYFPMVAPFGIGAANARGVTRHAVTIIAAALLCALPLCLGWIGGLNSDFFNIKSALLPINKVNPSADPLDARRSDRLAVQGSSVNTIPTSTNSAPETSKRGAQTTDSLLTKQTTRAPQPPAVERTKVLTRPAPVPETRPTTIEGWTIREVNGGTAVLEGPNGVWKATRGDTVPGVGKIESIVRWGNRWIVATSRLIQSDCRV
jgi:hypothetical protein